MSKKDIKKVKNDKKEEKRRMLHRLRRVSVLIIMSGQKKQKTIMRRSQCTE